MQRRRRRERQRAKQMVSKSECVREKARERAGESKSEREERTSGLNLKVQVFSSKQASTEHSSRNPPTSVLSPSPAPPPRCRLCRAMEVSDCVRGPHGSLTMGSEMKG